MTSRAGCSERLMPIQLKVRPGRDVVLHDAAVRPHPDAGDLGHIEMRDALGRHQPAPGDVAGVARQLLAEHLPAHRRMDAVGADENVAGRGAAIGERDRDAVRVLIEALDARAEAEAFLAEAAEQDVEQVGAVRGVVRRAEMRLRPLAERRVVEAIAGVPGAIVAAFRTVDDARQRIAEPERPQDARRVAADLEAGADLGEGRRLLEQFGLDAALAQRQQRRDAADAAARDQDLSLWSDTTGHLRCCPIRFNHLRSFPRKRESRDGNFKRNRALIQLH